MRGETVGLRAILTLCVFSVVACGGGGSTADVNSTALGGQTAAGVGGSSIVGNSGGKVAASLTGGTSDTLSNGGTAGTTALGGGAPTTGGVSTQLATGGALSSGGTSGLSAVTGGTPTLSGIGGSNYTATGGRPGKGAGGAGGVLATGGTSNLGNSLPSAGKTSSGGNGGVGGSATGGTVTALATGGSQGAGGSTATGGMTATGGTASHCLDQIKSGDETDVDCGGSCPPCALGKSCKVNADCTPGVCRTNVCGRNLKLSNFIVTPSLLSAVDVADIDGDGVLDAIGASPASVVKFHGAGDGTFTVTYSDTLGGGEDIHINDLNGDGLADVVLAGLASQPPLGVRMGQTTGFGPLVQYGVKVGNAGHIVLADVVGDHSINAVVGAAGLYVFPGNGDGTFGTPTWTGLSGQLNYAIPALLNTDAFIDYATMDINGRVAVVLGTAGGGFNSMPVYSYNAGPDAYLGFAMADFNHDGKLDLSCSPQILLGGGDGTFTFKSGASFGKIAIGDIDNDGRLDQVSVLAS